MFSLSLPILKPKAPKLDIKSILSISAVISPGSMELYYGNGLLYPSIYIQAIAIQIPFVTTIDLNTMAHHGTPWHTMAHQSTRPPHSTPWHTMEYYGT